MISIFYSWQSDLPETRAFIGDALRKSAKDINNSEDITTPLRVDHDTNQVAGWPEITSTILDKIEKCDIFVADITPITSHETGSRVCPNPNVLFELGYALATGMRRTRIICVVNTFHIPDQNINHLPFDIRGSRPLQYSLAPKVDRGVRSGVEDIEKSKIRSAFIKNMSLAIRGVIQAVDEHKRKNELRIKPHLAVEGNRYQVVIDCINDVPFQFESIVKESNNNIITGIPLGMTSIDPKGEKVVRFKSSEFNKRITENNIIILFGKFSHIQTDKRPVPEIHDFEVHYELRDGKAIEIQRVQPDVG
jgi:hypothetical protein